MISPETPRRFLVAGTAISERIIHNPHHLVRHGLGGVASTMALALAQAGNEVTLVTAVGTGPAAVQCRQFLDQAPFRTVITESNHTAGSATITTRQGEPISAKGSWPKLYGIARTAADLAPEHDCILVDCNIEYTEFRKTIAAHNINLINATTVRMLQAAQRASDIPKEMVTMNQRESWNLARNTGAANPQNLLRVLNTKAALITLGPNGWTLHRQDQPDLHSPAVPVPPNTDFVGCGDYATAGLAHAVIHGTDPAETINAFITAKLTANILKPLQ